MYPSADPPSSKVSVFVPHYERAFMLALASDEIVMDANAVLGPVDLSW